MTKPTFQALAQRAPREPLEAITLDVPPPPQGHDVDVEVMSCSVCHSDVHLLDGDWGDVARPLVPGHEIIGRVARAGDRAELAAGTIVGIGWQAGSCGACSACLSAREHLCTGGKLRTCVGRPGGFATQVRVDARFCFELPSSLDLQSAAPLLCAGLTVFSPLERLGAKPGMRVGVVGIGGLGHLAVRFARALGAEVIAFDPDASKRELVRSLGATELVDSRGPLPRAAVDLLLVTTHAPLLWNDWMRVLDLEGTLCLVGVPGAPLVVSPDPLMDEQKKLTGSVIGSPATMRRMLALAAREGIAPIVEHLPLERANEAIARVRDGAARMRVILDVSLAALALSLLLAIMGCSRSGTGGDAGADATTAVRPAATDTPASASPTASARPMSGAAGSGLEARRSVVTRIEADPILSANADALRKQHGGAIPAALAVQATDLGADRRRAIVVAEGRMDGTLGSPMLFVVDEHGALLWSKERPVAGIKPPVGPLAVAAGPHGRFAMAVCDPPTSTVALRLWDEDGSPFADFQVLEAKECDAISLLYWPQHGWLVALAAGAETRVQLVTESGGAAWSPGRVLGARFRTIAPVTLASDSPSSFVLVQYSQSPGVDRDVDHAVAFRYDVNAQPLWPAPVDLGAVRRIAPGQERIALTRTSDGVLRALLAGGVTVEIRSNGETRRVP